MISKKYISILLFMAIFTSLLPMDYVQTSMNDRSPTSASTIPYIHITSSNIDTYILNSTFKSGSGTIVNPFILRDYVIDCEGRSFGIKIDNLDSISYKYIEIVNCTIYNSSGSGIYFNNYHNGKIYNNTIFNCSDTGVWLLSSQNITVMDNTFIKNSNGISCQSTANSTIISNRIFNSTDYAMYLYQNQNNTVANNTLKYNSRGISLTNTGNTTVINNTVLFSYEPGLELSDSYRCNVLNNYIQNATGYNLKITGTSNQNLIMNNTIMNTEYDLVYLAYCYNNTLINNTMTGAGRWGICIYQSSNNSIQNNSISSCLENAISGYQSMNNSFIQNKFYNTNLTVNKEIVRIDQCNFTNFQENDFGNNQSKGIYATMSDNCNFIRNIHINGFYGLYLTMCKYWDIGYNNISFSDQGIYTSESSFLNVSNNRFQNCYNYAIRIENKAYNCSVINNTVENTTLDYMAVYLGQFVNGTFKNNQISDSAGYGLTIAGHTINATIANNTILRTYRDGIHVLVDSNSNLIENNTIYNNTNGICLYSSHFNKVRNNTLSGSSEHGIYLVETSAMNNITYNLVTNNYQGIYLQNGDNNEIGYNYLKNNTNGPYSESIESDDNWIHNNDMYYPYASFWANITTIVEGQSVVFDSSASMGDSEIHYFWDFNDTTGIVTIMNPEHQFLSAGIYNVSLTIIDAQSESEIFIQQIIVESDLIPIANFSISSNVSYVGRLVTFTDTTESGNLELTLEWDFGDASTNATGSPVSHVYSNAGVYNITLKSTDLNGDISYRVWNITILPNTFPSVSFSANATLIIVGDSILFIDNSYAGESPSSWQWNFGDSGSNTTVNTNTNLTHTYTTAGNFNVVCMIVDLDGDVALSSINVVVELDTFPIADFQISKLIFDVGETIQFNTQNVHGNTPLQYQWSFGDGTTNSSDKNVYHSYTNGGNYTVTLMVVDRDGDVALYSIMISVKEPAAPNNNGFSWDSIFSQPWYSYAIVFILALGVFMGISNMNSRRKGQKKPKKSNKNVEPTVDKVEFDF